jgi:pyruvate dehydrogenase E2 component (dihydrolipoamide acetyltransferase)
VKPGDVVEKEQSLVTLESDKATMDVPSSHAGVVKEVKVKVGDNISEGHVVILLEESGSASTKAAPVVSPAVAPQKAAPAAASASAPVAATGGLVNVTVPDIGDYKGVPVIEVHVKPGDVVEKEIHEELDDYRYRSDREFFKADLNLIKQTIDKILSKY